MAKGSRTSADGCRPGPPRNRLPDIAVSGMAREAIREKIARWRKQKAGADLVMC